mgnify:CR=1 FL=1
MKWVIKGLGMKMVECERKKQEKRNLKEIWSESEEKKKKGKQFGGKLWKIEGVKADGYGGCGERKGKVVEREKERRRVEDEWVSSSQMNMKNPWL